MASFLTSDRRFNHPKFHWCPPGYFPMSFGDPLARACIRDYAQRTPNRGLATDIEIALRTAVEEEEAAEAARNKPPG